MKISPKPCFIKKNLLIIIQLILYSQKINLILDNLACTLLKDNNHTCFMQLWTYSQDQINIEKSQKVLHGIKEKNILIVALTLKYNNSVNLNTHIENRSHLFNKYGLIRVPTMCQQFLFYGLQIHRGAKIHESLESSSGRYNGIILSLFLVGHKFNHAFCQLRNNKNVPKHSFQLVNT